ncbi:sensor histidine kinase [Nocardiopsis ganjiahuensis]|uniref:sensor histidine kinase n=1 Tax=Nocardiopsis ganjiahuensis TaxID=239984 RepID=UPI00034753C4|nr:sensor histidine kinase [Nocardiopsis ganjiahuensis]
MEEGRRSRRDLAVDGLLTVFAVGFGLLSFSGYAADIHPADRVPEWVLWLDLACLPLACAALWWRRDHPLAVAAGVALASSFSTSVLGALTVALIGLAIYRPVSQAVGVAALTVVLGLPWVVLVPATAADSVLTGILILVMLSAFVAWGAAIGSRRRLVDRLREDVRRERELKEERLAAARVAERRRIAREMHDVVAHRMSLLSVHAGALAYRTERAESGEAEPLKAAEVGAAVRVIRDNAHRVLDELSDILTVLRSDDLTGEDDEAVPQPRLADVSRLVAEAVEAGERVTYTSDLPEGAEPRDPVQRTAYRVVQEGLTNSRKHAPGAKASVTVSGAPGRGLVVVVSNVLPVGRSVREIPGAEAGLAGLAERVQLEGGHLRHGPAHGRYRLTATLPWPQGRASGAPGGDRRKVS